MYSSNTPVPTLSQITTMSAQLAHTWMFCHWQGQQSLGTGACCWWCACHRQEHLHQRKCVLFSLPAFDTSMYMHRWQVYAYAWLALASAIVQLIFNFPHTACTISAHPWHRDGIDKDEGKAITGQCGTLHHHSLSLTCWGSMVLQVIRHLHHKCSMFPTITSPCASPLTHPLYSQK